MYSRTDGFFASVMRSAGLIILLLSIVSVGLYGYAARTNSIIVSAFIPRFVSALAILLFGVAFYELSNPAVVGAIDRRLSLLSLKVGFHVNLSVVLATLTTIIVALLIHPSTTGLTWLPYVIYVAVFCAVFFAAEMR